jgi:hypothetical protein
MEEKGQGGAARSASHGGAPVSSDETRRADSASLPHGAAAERSSGWRRLRRSYGQRESERDAAAEGRNAGGKARWRCSSGYGYCALRRARQNEEGEMEWRRRGGAVRRLNAVGGRPPPTAARRRWPRGGHRLRTVGRPRLSGSTGAGEEMGQAGLSSWAKTDAEAREGKEPKSKSLQNLKWKSKANLRHF